MEPATMLVIVVYGPVKDTVLDDPMEAVEESEAEAMFELLLDPMADETTDPEDVPLGSLFGFQ
jgi:hypothetical protein